MDYNTARGKLPLWQSIAILVLIGGLVYTAVYYLWINPQNNQRKTTESMPTPTPTVQTTNTESSIDPNRVPQKVMVVVNKDGFTPTNIVIFPGDTVVWQNKSGKDIKVSSNPHPTHADYTPLNLDVTKANGEISLSFPTKGTYGYHDHLNPSHLGMIVVQ